MLNKTTLADYFTGLVILTHSIPKTLVDANKDNLRDCLTQTLHDTADELGISLEVNWSAQGEPADIIPINRKLLAQLHAVGDALIAELESLPSGGSYD